MSGLDGRELGWDERTTGAQGERDLIVLGAIEFWTHSEQLKNSEYSETEKYLFFKVFGQPSGEQTDRPSGVGRTDHRRRTGLRANGQTVRRLQSTDRPSGEGQTYW